MPKSKQLRTEKRESPTSGQLLTLSEVAHRAGVSIPTAQAYKRKYQTRLPSVGAGRKQRYKPEAVDAFKKLREENRQRQGQTSVTPPLTARPGTKHRDALSLAEISRRTKIAYPTLLRYLKTHGSGIPSLGSGRTRRFPARAVQVFERLRKQSRRGRPRIKAVGREVAVDTSQALAARIQRVESMQADIARQLLEVLRVLKQPLQVTIQPE